MEVGGAEYVCLQYINHLRSFEGCLLLQVRSGPLLSQLQATVPVFELFERTSALSEAPQQPRLLRHLSCCAARLHHLVLSGLRKMGPLHYCYSLLWQAHRVAELAHQHNCSTCVSFITLVNVIAVLAKVFFYRQLRVVINVHDVTSQILEHSKLRRFERFLLKRLIRFCYPWADAIVAVAQGIKRDLIESFGVPADKIVVIYNPIDVHRVRSRAAEPVIHPWFADRSMPLIIAVGRLVKLKGFDLLIRSVAQLSIPARLAIIGDGEERAALECLVTQLGLTDRVVLLGFQENPWKYMAQADLFVLSSLTEGMPNVIGEAMALGLPVLVTDCSPGVREYLDGGRAGLLVPPGDPRALARSMEQLLSDASLRRELARRGYERVAQFDLPTTVRAYESLLEHLLQGD
jgi:glycosyltransferase involved in cell wall biosynthesis